MAVTGYRIANIDIENFPNLGYAWEQMEKYPNRKNLIDVERPWCLASFAYKWEGDDGDPKCFALPDFKSAYRNDPFDDGPLLDRMFDILSSAHLVAGHNIDAFDIRKINARLLMNGSPPPLPYRTFDTLKEARKHFLLPSYRLGDIATALGCPFGGKLEHEGWPLWLKCMKGMRSAWSRFKAYNVQDVTIGQWVYHRIRPWSRSHPNITIMGDKDNLCPVCGYKTKFVDWSGLKSFGVTRFRCLSKKCGKTSYGQRAKLDIRVLSS